MTSRASKLRAKRARAGRPRKENVARFPSGQIKHEEREKAVTKVAIDALKRVHNLDYHKNGYSGFVLGRMFLDGKVSEYELEAGIEYASRMARYYSLTGIPAPSPRAQSLFSVKGHEGETSTERAKLAREASNNMMRLEGILLRMTDGPRVKSTVFSVCVLDYDHLRTLPDHQLNWLKLGLRELHSVMGLAKSAAI